MIRTALITGGSGALGTALVRRFILEGCQVAFTWHTAAESAAALAAETGALACKADLCSRAQVQDTLRAVLECYGQLDILVNNAGRTQVMPFALIEEEDWDALMAANLKTMYLMTQESIRGMIQRKQGVIVNIGSLAGHRLLDVPVHYATAKAAVSGFTLALAKELSRYNIRVNEVVPGLLSKGVGTLVPAREMEDYTRHCTANRPGSPEEVAEVVAFLASDKASYINAQSIGVDGGI